MTVAGPEWSHLDAGVGHKNPSRTRRGGGECGVLCTVKPRLGARETIGTKVGQEGKLEMRVWYVSQCHSKRIAVRFGFRSLWLLCIRHVFKTSNYSSEESRGAYTRDPCMPAR